MANRALHLLDNDLAPASAKAKASQAKRYLSFCADLYLDPLDCSPIQLVLYIAHLSLDCKYHTIRCYLSGVNYLLEDYGRPTIDYSNVLIHRAINGAKRILGTASVQAIPLLPRHLLSMFAHLQDSLGHTAFWAALLCGFRALFRKCHYTLSDSTLTRSSFAFFEWGVLITVRKTKTIQFREKELLIPITRVSNKSLCAVWWLERHFSQISAVPGAPAFLIMDKGSPTPLTYHVFDAILKELASRCSFPPGRVSSHGLRRGGATYLALMGVPLDVIKETGDWSSDQVYKYLKRPLQERITLDTQVASFISGDHLPAIF